MLSVQLHKRRGDFGLNLQIESSEGGVIALFGPSGCGKSTAIHLIAGLLTPDQGRIQVEEQVLFETAQGINVSAERRRIGYVFQDARLFPHLNVLGNLRYGLKRATAAMQIDFDTVIELLGIGALLSRRPQQLSGGEKQRVAIGRALLSQPRLLLLDEPLASLDAARREEVLPYLERLRDFLRIPMIYVSHQFEEVLRLANHVVLMNQGSCLAQGTMSAISLHPALRTLIGPEAIGAVIDGQVTARDAQTGLAQVSVGSGCLNIESQSLQVGQVVRLQLLARDLILALNRPEGLSVRNALPVILTGLTPDGAHAVLVELGIGDETLVARVTTSAAQELQLHIGQSLWVLIKAVMLRGHVFGAANRTPSQ